MSEAGNLERALSLCTSRIDKLVADGVGSDNAELRMEENNYYILLKRIHECKHPSFVSTQISRRVRR